MSTVLARYRNISGDSHERYYFGDANKAVYDNGGYINSANYAAAYMTIETLGTELYVFRVLGIRYQ